MQALTHIAAATLTYVFIRGLNVEYHAPEIAALAVGSLVSDIDTTNSGLGRFAKPLSNFLERKFGHRTLTHSFLFGAIATLALYPLSHGVALAFLWGLLSHLFLDTLNPAGVPLFYPLPHRFWLMPYRLRIRYGSPAEFYLTLILFSLALLLWLAARDGFDTSFRRLVATPETAVMDYLKFNKANAVFVELDGFNSETQEPIKGKFKVVEALGRNGVLIEDKHRYTYQVSKNGQIVSYRIRSYPEYPIYSEDQRLEFENQSIQSFLNSLPQGAKTVYITGTLQLFAPIMLTPPPVGTFPRITTPPSKMILNLHSAYPEDFSRGQK